MSAAALRANQRLGQRPARRGGPLVMLVVLLAGWSGARAVWWENPFAPLAEVGEALLALPEADPVAAPAPDTLSTTDTLAVNLPPLAGAGLLPAPLWTSGRPARLAPDPRVTAGHRLLWLAALRHPGLRAGGEPAPDPLAPGQWAGGSTPAPFLPPLLPPRGGTAASAGGRWSVDGWAFWRQGADSAPVSQGRVPIYGASQAGAVLQYRLAPGSARDPRLYARAYRALVRRGESEAALGASARPFARVPLRLTGEVRYTDAAFGNDIRPAAFGVTEFAPLALPMGTQLEAYGQAGWVGGPQPTAFADGQASLTREVGPVAALTDDALRLSLGAGAWAGAQEDAQRVDLGPTLRLDLRIGTVPARLSVDWRQQVAGDASPGSGVAATLSTGF
jgi:hypothetical protein